MGRMMRQHMLNDREREYYAIFYPVNIMMLQFPLIISLLYA